MTSHDTKLQTAAWAFAILLALLCTLAVDGVVGAVRTVSGIVHLVELAAVGEL